MVNIQQHNPIVTVYLIWGVNKRSKSDEMSKLTFLDGTRERVVGLLAILVF